MTVEQMRHLLKIVYPSEKWYDKVDKMTDNQVIAVYNRMLEAGKIVGDGGSAYIRKHSYNTYVKSCGKNVTKGFEDGIKNTNPHIVKKVEKLTESISSKQITFDDLWRHAGYSYVGTSEFMEGATSGDAGGLAGGSRTDEIT